LTLGSIYFSWNFDALSQDVFSFLMLQNKILFVYLPLKPCEDGFSQLPTKEGAYGLFLFIEMLILRYLLLVWVVHKR
jgi:hypothetical protein